MDVNKLSSADDSELKRCYQQLLSPATSVKAIPSRTQKIILEKITKQKQKKEEISYCQSLLLLKKHRNKQKCPVK